VRVSRVLEALGTERSWALASVLFTLGKDNTEQDIEAAAAAYARVIHRLRSLSPAWEEYQRGLITPNP